MHIGDLLYLEQIALNWIPIDPLDAQEGISLIPNLILTGWLVMARR